MLFSWRTNRAVAARMAAAIFAACLIMSVMPAQAQDAGTPDSLILEHTELFAGISTPVSVRVVNDYQLAYVSMPLEFSAGDFDAFVALDSIVFRNRLADPNVLDFRVLNTSFVDGPPQDSVLIVWQRVFGFYLPPGNDVVADLYVTATRDGSVFIDSCWFQPTNTLMFGAQISGDPYIFHEVVPTLIAGEFPVVMGTLPPVFSLPDPDPVLAGDLLAFSVSAESPEGYDVDVTLQSFVRYDDAAAGPSTAPGTSGDNPLAISWVPAGSDVGVWLATFEACNTMGMCATAAVVVQVVDDLSAMTEFTVSSQPVDAGVVSLFAADFMGDATPELFVGGFGDPGGSERLYQYSPTGGFSAVYDYADAGEGCRGAQPAFLNDDQYLDVVGRRLFHIAHLFSDGAGDFTTTDVSHSHMAARASAVGEFTGDGFVDYISSDSRYFELYPGDSSGLFSSSQPLLRPDTVLSLNSEDFDGDGDRDLAAGTTSGLSILLNDGLGSFSIGATYPQVYLSAAIDVTQEGSDFNSDGEFDLSIASPSIGGGFSELLMFLGNGDGTFVPSVLRTLAGQLVATCAGDFNNDTYLDVAYLNSARRYVGLLFGDGAGAFVNERRYALTDIPARTMACTDFDLDGDVDVVVYAADGFSQNSNSELIFLENQTDPTGITTAGLVGQGGGNLALSLVTGNGHLVSQTRTSLPGGAFYERSGTDGVQNVVTAPTRDESRIVLQAKPRAGQAVGELFSLSYRLGNRQYRLVENQPMTADGYTFPILPTFGQQIAPASGSYTFNAQPTFVWPVAGSYTFELATDPSFSNILHSAAVLGSSYSLPDPLNVADTSLYYWRVMSDDKFSPGETYALNVIAGGLASGGDVSGDGLVNLTDITLIVGWIFAGGAEPPNPEAGDVNRSGSVSLTDLTILVNYLFLGGELP